MAEIAFLLGRLRMLTVENRIFLSKTSGAFMRQIHTIVKCSYPKLATVTGIQNLKPAISEQKKCAITSDISVHVVKYFIQAKELPFRCVGRV
jgi:hypothetical protein